MKYKSSILKSLLVGAIILAALLVLGFLAEGVMQKKLEALFHPEVIPEITQKDREEIAEHLEVVLPPSVKFTEGFVHSGRDLTYIYIFELDTTQKDSDETTDAFIRRMLSMDPEDYSDVETADSFISGMFSNTLSEHGYTYTHVIAYERQEYAEIYYCEISGNIIQLALAFGI